MSIKSSPTRSMYFTLCEAFYGVISGVTRAVALETSDDEALALLTHITAGAVQGRREAQYGKWLRALAFLQGSAASLALALPAGLSPIESRLREMVSVAQTVADVLACVDRDLSRREAAKVERATQIAKEIMARFPSQEEEAAMSEHFECSMCGKFSPGLLSGKRDDGYVKLPAGWWVIERCEADTPRSYCCGACAGRVV